MVRATSPLLFATARDDGAASVTTESIPLDFSVRAPFGIAIAKVDLFANLPGAATVPGLHIAVALINDVEAPSDAQMNELSINESAGLGPVTNLNSDFIAAGNLSSFNISAVATTGRPGNTINPINSVNFLSVPLEARPMSVRPIRLAARLTISTGSSLQLWAYAAHITYQTVQLSDEELVNLVASR